MAPDSECKWCKQHLSGQSLHPIQQCVLFGPPLFQLAILDPHKNHSTPSHKWSLTISDISTLMDFVFGPYNALKMLKNYRKQKGIQEITIPMTNRCPSIDVTSLLCFPQINHATYTHDYKTHTIDNCLFQHINQYVPLKTCHVSCSHSSRPTCMPCQNYIPAHEKMKEGDPYHIM